MLLHGDEVGRTQNGNNNAYCQDSELSWLDWERDAWQDGLLTWTQRLVKLRSEHVLLRRRDYFQGRPIRRAGVKDIYWLRSNGEEMNDEAWFDAEARCLGMLLPGPAADLTDEEGLPSPDDTLLLLVNAAEDDCSFTLPSVVGRRYWELALDSAKPEANPSAESFMPGGAYEITGRSLALLINPRDGERGGRR
jgi:glycogen operon protein